VTGEETAFLVARCLNGDTDAYGRLVVKYQAAVYATAYYYVGRHGEAEDIAQEAFLAAFRGLRRVRDPARFGPWLREISCRTAANWLRRNGARLEMETPLPFRRTVSIEDARKGPQGMLEAHELQMRVRKAIDALPERYRLPVILRYLQELSYDEIGEFTGDTRDEIRGILQRAGRQLREILAETESDSEGNSGWHPAHESKE